MFQSVEAAEAGGLPLCDFICRILTASDMAVCCVAPHLNRTEEDIDALIKHPAMMGGSDGIFTGEFPHPRGRGCFARYIGHHVRERKNWTLERAIQQLAAHPASRFGLHDRGVLRKGLAADVTVFNPDTICDNATFADGKPLASGVSHVLVNGKVVLDNDQRTPALPGRGLRRTS